MKFFLVILLFLLNSFSISNATDCNFPSVSIVNQQLIDEVTSGGGEGGSFGIRGGPYYTCEVQGTTMGTYQELSVIMEYTSSTNQDRIGQFEMICQISPGGWGRRSDSLTVLSQGPDVTYDGSIGLRTNCSSCINTASNDNNCVACNPACNSGLMRCFGSGSDDCCVAFEDDGECKTDFNCNTNNFVANEQNNFTCACGLSSCSDGYTLNSTSCTCTLTDICVADNPCNNNGSCTLGSSPDNFTCDCTGTGFMGLNCTDPEPVAMTTSSLVISSTPDTPISSSAPMATSSPSLITSCVDNCSVCLNSTCCSVCNNDYNVTINGCTCISVILSTQILSAGSKSYSSTNSKSTACKGGFDIYNVCTSTKTHSGLNQRHSLTKLSSVTVTTMTIIPSNHQEASTLGLNLTGLISGLTLLVLLLLLSVIAVTVAVGIHFKKRLIQNSRQDCHQMANTTAKTGIRAGSLDESSLTVQANPNPIYDYVDVHECSLYDDTIATPIVHVTDNVAYGNTVGYQHHPSYLQTEERHDDDVATPTVSDNVAYVCTSNNTRNGLIY